MEFEVLNIDYVTKNFNNLFKKILIIKGKAYGYDLLNDSKLYRIKKPEELIKVDKENPLFGKFLDDDFKVELLDSLFNKLEDKMKFANMNERTYFRKKAKNKI